MTARQLDVRNEVPKRRHELIFETYFGLHPGEAFESGPDTWRVLIGRTQVA